MEKEKIGYFLGRILLFVGMISIIYPFVMGGSCPICNFMNNPFFWLGLIFICSGIMIIIVVYSLYKRKAKGFSIDEQIKRVYHSSIWLFIFGWSMFIMGVLFIGSIYGFVFVIIGLLIGIVGLYGIILYRSKPEKLRDYLLKRNDSKEEHKVQD